MDPAKMKVVDLRSELGALGLDTKGNKPALVERLKKALEAKSGKTIADTTILDTSTEDADEPSTPRRPAPAARITRRSSSSRLAATPSKQPREDPPSPPIIQEENIEDLEPESSPNQEEEEAEPLVAPVPQPVPAPTPQRAEETTAPKVSEKDEDEDCPPNSEMYSIDDKSQSPINEEENTPESMDVPESENKDESEEKTSSKAEPMEEGKDKNEEDKKEDDEEEKNQNRELTEEEEWEQMNERLKIKDQERYEREKKQAEEDAKRFEELSNDPIRLQRLKRKHEKKQRWSTFYKSVEVTNEVLTPPEESELHKGRREANEVKIPEPEINDNRITLSWYDSDLNQYLETPSLNGVVPISEGAFTYAWAGARGTHGVQSGRVCYEVKIGSVVTTTESSEKEAIISGIRVGWSTEESSLHLGEGELSFGYESNARAVTNGEFKEYGQQLSEKDVVGVYLDLESTPCKILYTVNGVEQGVAFEFEREKLEGKSMFPHVLTKNYCYKVNFGYDRYSMLTKTRIVRNRVEIPVEQVIEEKKAIEAELKRQREEAARKEKERRERDKKEREERQRKKREERERLERERKEREAQERKDKEEEEKMDDDDKEKAEEDKEKAEEDKEKAEEDKEKAEEDKEEPEVVKDAAQETEPKENGDDGKKDEEPEVKVEPTEPMETDADAAAEEAKEVKPEPSEVADADVTEVTEEQVLEGKVLLDKRIKFVIRHTLDVELDGPEACLLPGYVFIMLADLVEGPRAPETKALCEVILMVGMPGSGKTYWAKQHSAENPDKRYNIISTGALFDRMKVDCKPFRTSYEGRWDAMVSKCAKCVLKLLEIAKGRRRNFILDQTNVYPSAQRRKLKEFDGYRRVAVAVVTDPDVYRERCAKRETADGKEVPDGAVVDMKANFTLPEKCPWLDDVIYPELGYEEAKAIVDGFHKEAKAAGVTKEKEKRERSASRDGPPPKRARDERRHRDDRRQNRDFQRDREDRWGTGGGGGRWGPANRGGGGGGGGGGSRWGQRDRSGGPGPQGPPRFDRWGGPPGRNNDFGRDRDDFRGGRGGRGGPSGRGPGGPGGPGGRGDRGQGPQGMDRFRGPGDRNSRGPQQDKRPNQPPQGGQGTWQRGNQGGRPRPPQAPPGSRPNQKDGSQNQNQNQNSNQQLQQQQQQQQQQQPGWNQWAGGWGGWGNWNQNQGPAPQSTTGWGNWGNWGNWNQNAGNNAASGGQQGQGQNAKSQSQSQGQGQAQGQAGQQGQWPGNYTAQQWYQWQQWQQQQQQQGWPGYQQNAAGQGGGNAAEQAWAQYYQSYGGGANAANTTTNSTNAVDKK